MNTITYSSVLTEIRSLREHSWFHSDPVRFIYWATPPGKGVGVSFLDPTEWRCVVERQTLNSEERRLIERKEPVLSIGISEKDSLSKALSVESMCPFEGLTVVTRPLIDAERYLLDTIVYCWVDKDVVADTPRFWEERVRDNVESYHNVIRDYAYNDYTNRAFNYFYINKLMKNKELCRKVLGYSFFTDAGRVSREFGYSSPAYALALFQSLYLNGVLVSAMGSFESFLTFHPYDEIVRACEMRAKRRYGDGIMVDLGDPLESIENERVEMCKDDRHDGDARKGSARVLSSYGEVGGA